MPVCVKPVVENCGLVGSCGKEILLVLKNNTAIAQVKLLVITVQECLLVLVPKEQISNIL